MKPSESQTEKFEYTVPAPLNTRLILLTKDGRIEVGAWKGEPPGWNRTYLGWAPLPARDAGTENLLRLQLEQQ